MKLIARPREFDEEQALDAAMLLFWEKGYEATSLSDLTSQMGIRKPSLYAAFGDKKELFHSALKKYIQHAFKYMDSQLQSASSVKDAFRNYVDDIMEKAYGEEAYRGCFCVNTMVELASQDQWIEEVTRDFQTKVVGLFQHKIEQGIQSGELKADLDAAAVAQALNVSFIGFRVMLRSRPDKKMVENAAKVILTLLG